jgi:putative addiction module component (TIGR02574 family)
MGEAGKRLLKEALELPEAERAELAAELMASFDGPPDPDVDDAWAAEIERRAAKVLSGESEGIPWDEARARIEGELRRR